MKEMGPTVVRYPGGNFVSGYRWEDGVGPVEDRPVRIDGAWHTIETNAFGLHEFMDWAKEADVEVMEAVNLGTRGVREARAHSSSTRTTPAARTGRICAARTVRSSPSTSSCGAWATSWTAPGRSAARPRPSTGGSPRSPPRRCVWSNPSIELVAVGSSGRTMPTFGTWEHTVLTHAYDEVDFISMHAYYQEHDGDAESFLAESVDMDAFIEGVIATIDAVKASGKHTKQIDISFDEWNVWDQVKYNDVEAKEIEKAG